VSVRVAIVTNIPAPYRVPVFNLLAATPGIDLHVFYAMEREPDRNWDLPAFAHAHTFLNDSMYTRAGRFIHNNTDIYAKLKAFAPDVVVTTGYNPTHLYAFAYTLRTGCHHVAMTDGSLQSEASLSKAHNWVRRFVLSRTKAFIAASNGGRRLFESYGIHPSKIYFSPLCANSTVDWSMPETTEKPFDLLFSGRLVPIKKPQFALEVANLAARALGRRVRIAILGSGPLESHLRLRAQELADTVDVHFAGHVSQQEIPQWFLRSKLFLFPSLWDPWGIVANEACMAGLPVLISPHAGAAGELVQDGINGLVLPINAQQWANAAVALLQNPTRYTEMSHQARRLVEPYSFDNAAQGIVDAVRTAAAPRVLCVQRRLTHYRVALFEELRNLLAKDGVVFDLAYGQPCAQEAEKSDQGDIGWAHKVHCHYRLKGQLCWQNPTQLAKHADLVVVTQENKMLFNLWAMFVRHPKRLAFWGHGRNFQSSRPNGLFERFKQTLSRRCDWWFAYTGVSERRLVDLGFSPEKITNLQNAVDTQALLGQIASVTTEEVESFRAGLRVGAAPLGIYVGSLYKEKRIDFLLAAAERIAMRVPGFVLLVIGNGAERNLVNKAKTQHAWLRYEGPQFGRDKAVALRSADVMLNPGLVGLGILDAFAAGLPMITTDCGIHSPEIDYLRNGENGIMTSDNLEAYVEAAVAVLKDPGYALRLRNNARSDAGKYTISNMAQNFRCGILAALALPAR